MIKLLSHLLFSYLILISTISFAEEGKKMQVVYKIIDYAPSAKIDNLQGNTVERQKLFEYVPLRSDSDESSVWLKGTAEGGSVMAYNTKYEAKIKVLEDFSQTEEPYLRELKSLDKTLKQYLKKSNVVFVNDQEELALEVMIGTLSFGSLQGVVIDDVGYHVTKNGEELFSGVFSQKKNCAHLTSLIQGKCGGDYIGKFLAKDIQLKFKSLNNFRSSATKKSE